MSQIVRFAVSLDEDLLTQFDADRRSRHYENRSEAIRDLIRDHLIHKDWDTSSDAVGTITLVYDHHAANLMAKLTAIQHDYHDLILSTMHLHIDHDNCLEVIAVKGNGEDVRAVADALISIKGVKHGKLTTTSTGDKFN